MGIEPFIWGKYFYKLYVALISFLSDLGLNVLAHVINPNFDIFATNWYSTSNLGLDGDLVGGWSNFILGSITLVSNSRRSRIN